jgi:DNA-binding XRE family transcriptional regulator
VARNSGPPRHRCLGERKWQLRWQVLIAISCWTKGCPSWLMGNRIGRRIAFFREEAELTRAELAEQIDSSEAEVEAWETGSAVVYPPHISRQGLPRA